MIDCLFGTTYKIGSKKGDCISRICRVGPTPSPRDKTRSPCLFKNNTVPGPYLFRTIHFLISAGERFMYGSWLCVRVSTWGRMPSSTVGGLNLDVNWAFSIIYLLLRYRPTCPASRSRQVAGRRNTGSESIWRPPSLLNQWCPQVELCFITMWVGDGWHFPTGYNVDRTNLEKPCQTEKYLVE